MRFICVSLGYHPDVLGGAWRVSAEQAAGLAARGHSVDVITAHPGGDLPAFETRDGVRIHRFPQTDGSFLANWRAENRAAAGLIRQCLAASADPVLLLQHHAFLEPAVASAPARVLHVYHGPWAEEYRFASVAHPRGRLRRCLDAAIVRAMHRVERRALKRADRVIVLSRHFAARLREWHGPRPREPEIAPGGVDFRRFQPLEDRASIRAAYGIKPGERLLIAMRRLDPRMGLEVLVDAFAEIAGEQPCRLWLTGRGPAETNLRDRIGRLGLGDRIRLLGLVPEDEVPRLLNAADIALMPSLDLEGFGLATAEALACGTPVLGSRAGATPELLEPLDPSLLFRPGSVPDLACRLRLALTRPDSLPSRQACAAYARARFSWDHQVSACERIARELLAS